MKQKEKDKPSVVTRAVSFEGLGNNEYVAVTYEIRDGKVISMTKSPARQGFEAKAKAITELNDIVREALNAK